ncbi:integrase [Actinomadura rugatobispora]|uniref:Integrase n=1 Tax=Actinomadura rugatobispora TaxID=1994 RepID=A0ABW1ADK0_9ACTN|nr:protein phosphatase 2C domain-containing protein [Actinomadura rugatobispora]
MRVAWATELGDPRRGNEDFVAAAPGAVVVLDGCGLALGTDLGCVHGTAWYSRSLGMRLLSRLVDGLGDAPQAGPPVGPPEGAHRPDERPLVGRLAGAIADVAASHRATCDLTCPTTPAATVVALRVRGDLVDYLVLADSTLLLDGADGLQEITGGPYYAAADPSAAQYAITGTVPLGGLRAAYLMTDGATRPADLFGMADWRGLAGLVEKEGPAALIARTREIERTDPRGIRWPRAKPHDDATVAHCVFEG